MPCLCVNSISNKFSLTPNEGITIGYTILEEEQSTRKFKSYLAYDERNEVNIHK